MPGSLHGLRVLELAGIGPGPFCCMMLADLGAEVLRIDRACPYYDTHDCADGRYVAVGALEPQFLALLLKGLGLDAARFADRTDPARWPAIRAEFAAIVARHPRDHWATALEGRDACVAPVLAREAAPRHPHNMVRGTFLARGGGAQPAPSPRFSRTPAAEPASAPRRGSDGAAALAAWGVDPALIARLTPAPGAG